MNMIRVSLNRVKDSDCMQHVKSRIRARGLQNTSSFYGERLAMYEWTGLDFSRQTSLDLFRSARSGGKVVYSSEKKLRIDDGEFYHEVCRFEYTDPKERIGDGYYLLEDVIDD